MAQKIAFKRLHKLWRIIWKFIKQIGAWCYIYLGLGFLWQKIRIPKSKKKGSRQPSGFVLWVVGIYVAVFSFQQTLYEIELNRLTTRFGIYADLLSNGYTNYHILMDFIYLQSDSIPHKIDPWWNPVEVYNGYNIREPNKELVRNVGRIAPVFIDNKYPDIKYLTSDIGLRFDGPESVSHSLFYNHLQSLDYNNLQFDVASWDNEIVATSMNGSQGSFKSINTKLKWLRIDKSFVNLYLSNYGAVREISRFSAYNSFVTSSDVSVNQLYFDEGIIANSYLVGIDIEGKKLNFGNITCFIDCSIKIPIDSLFDNISLYNLRDTTQLIFYNSKLNGADTSNISLDELKIHLRQFDSIPFELKLPIAKYLN